jgi:dihydroorotate dehydrogenase/NAD-dependent dihydropyrimidine dehydrogenase PreA subunit
MQMDVNEVNLSVDFLGRRLRTPLAVTESPLTGNAERIRWVAEHPVGIIFTKGIRPRPANCPSPYLARAGRSLLNSDWTDIGFEQWCRDIRELQGLEVPVVASIAKNYVSPQEAAEMAEMLARERPAAISLVDYNAEELIEAVKLTRPRVRLPLMVKLVPFVPRLEEVLRRLAEAGIDAVAAMDSVGPAMEIDIETGLPSLGNEDGSGWLSGMYIKPITVKYIYEISRFVELPVVGVGGVSNHTDVLEMIMAGATVVGMVAAPLLNGLEVLDKAAEGLRQHLAKRGIADINEVRGLTRRQVAEMGLSYGLRARIIEEMCNDCRLCARSCFVRAIMLTDGKPWVDQTRCVGCGLCTTVCNREGIVLEQS